MSRGINERHPPTTQEWNQHEARFGQIGPKRSRPAKAGERRGPDPVPMLTPEQVQRHAKWLYTATMLLIDALDGEPWDGRWTNKLMHAHLFARNAIKDAAKQSEEISGSVAGNTSETERHQEEK